MAEKQNSEAGAQLARLERIYVKHLVFEALTPLSADGRAGPPTGDIHIGVMVNEFGEGRREVIVEIKITAKDRETGEPCYRLEVQQAGQFSLQNFSESELERVVNIYCPNVLFPYARQQVSSTIVNGGFPGLIMAPVNFEDLYRQQSAARRESAGESDAAD